MRIHQVLITCSFLLGTTAVRGVEPAATVFANDLGQAPATEVRDLALMPVSFEFATREEGHELRVANVHVLVVCPVVGKVFEGVSEGPFLVAALPGGRYEVVASREGRTQRISLTVARGEPRRVTLHW